jgi:hypothetical protein
MVPFSTLLADEHDNTDKDNRIDAMCHLMTLNEDDSMVMMIMMMRVGML